MSKNYKKTNLCEQCRNMATSADSNVQPFDLIKHREGIDKCIRLITTDSQTLLHSVLAHTSVELKQLLISLEYPRDKWPQTERPVAFLFECTTEHFMEAIRNLTNTYNQGQLEELCHAVWETNKEEIESFVNDFGEVESVSEPEAETDEDNDEHDDYDEDDDDEMDDDDNEDAPESTYMLVDQMSEIVSVLSIRKTMKYLEEGDEDQVNTFEFGGIRDGYRLELLLLEAKCLIAWSENKTTTHI